MPSGLQPLVGREGDRHIVSATPLHFDASHGPPSIVIRLAHAANVEAAAVVLLADVCRRPAAIPFVLHHILHRSPLDAATLRQNVTSPGGTTAAALEVLMAEGGLERLMTAAIAAATKRSRDLAG